jgi:SAM-dependent methyltransferase
LRDQTPPGESGLWKHETRLHYDRVVGEYIETYYSDLTDAPWLDRFCSGLKAERPQVLDAGCGPGHFSTYLGEQGCDVVGVDGSTGMIAAARRLTPRGDFRVMDFTELDFESGSFDGVICAYALLHLPKDDALTALSEFRRVLRAGGVLALIVKQGQGTHVLDSPLVANETCYVQLFEPEETRAMLNRAGFKVIDTDSANAGALELQFRKLFFLAVRRDVPSGPQRLHASSGQ